MSFLTRKDRNPKFGPVCLDFMFEMGKNGNKEIKAADKH
jgi:hypothetical protein